MFRFQKFYFLAACGLLLLEIYIALAVHDAVIRPYGGDFLATILLGFLISSFISVAAWRVAVAAVLVSYVIEILQYFDLLTQLGLQHSRVARIVFGSHFEWGDMLAYTLGGLLLAGLTMKKREPAPAC